MVGNSGHVHGNDPPRGAVNADINDPGFAHYRYRRSHRAGIDFGADEPAPLFLSSQIDEYDADWERRTTIPRSRLRIGLLTASAVAAVAAAVFALLSAGVTRDTILSAKALLVGVSPVGVRADLAEAVRAVATPASPAIASQPSRAEIAAAYQEAIQSQIVAVEVPAAAPVEPLPAAPQARRLDPDAVAALLKRANSLLAIGDIVSARLLLERAADAQHADAALLLARTYDPDVLGTLDKRSITPDPETARLWYRKAAELGSQSAQQRLAQMQN
ncbi:MULTISPECIES: hypothetical protein [Bradyrhizobium]|jgi:hypothetical protein|uniref:hypothetical protein n=1 Tax=Bradyrhizobium TaxID=374 RepID=UPI0004B0A39D|nr:MULTISPECIES: hypothetical protein [Bradyrhizobium]MCW2354802.1 hypothetical protein [Bradyrhizobium elkanii]MDI2055001.1 hypothetical protein [Bradyrhizobium sp. Mp19]